MGALLAALALLATPGDTLRIHPLDRPPSDDGRVDSLAWGPPQIRVPVGQGTASIWLLGAGDSLYLAVAIPDSSRSWADAVAICLAVGGEAGRAPGHDDFRFSWQRTLDSSVVYRGRNGRWEPPLDDPDWRLGPARSGGGWAVASADDGRRWTLVMRMDPAWLAGRDGRRPTLGLLIHDDDPSRWFAWPAQPSSAGVLLVERTPALWVPIAGRVP